MKQGLPWLLLTVSVIGGLAGCTTDSLEPDSRRDAAALQSDNPVQGDTLIAAADAPLSTTAKNSNYGGAATMQVKITAPQDSTSRAVVRFDQAAIASLIGAGTLITAILELPLQESGTAHAGNDIDVHRMLKGWTESGVTWNCGEDLHLSNDRADCPETAWRMTGANLNAFQAAPTARAHLGPGQAGLARFDVTSDVLAFLSGTSNHGWLVNAGSSTSRVTFWSREATLKPSLILSVSAPGPEQRLIRVVETGVEGGPATRDTSYTFGTSVAYDFRAADGYHDLRVTLDGQVVPSAGSFVMDTVHFLRVTALRKVEMPAGGEALLQSARAILTSSDPAAAFQAHLDEVLDSYQSLGEAEATRRLQAIYQLAYDPVQDSAALRRVDDALSGQVFDVYPRPDQAGALQSRSLASQTDDAPEPTVYLYVNGIRTDERETAAMTMGKLLNVLFTHSLLHSTDSVKYFYNRTSIDQPRTLTPAEQAEYCARWAGAVGSGDDSFERLFLLCLGQPVPPESDIWEAFRQYRRIYVGSGEHEEDAGRLAARIQEWRKAGSHVLVVPHSEGNMMLQQAVARLQASGEFDAQRDSSCIGAMSLAAPTDWGWPLDEYHLQHVIVRGDPIPDLGGILPGYEPNGWGRLNTPLSDLRDREVASMELFLPLAVLLPHILVDYIALKLEWGLRLHSVDEGYFGQNVVRQEIAGGLRTLYKECSIGSLEAASPGDTLGIGFTRNLAREVIVLNQNERPLYGRTLQWSSSAPEVASVDSSGTLTTHSLGTAVITARSGERTATLTFLVRAGGGRSDSFTAPDGTLLSDHTPDGGDFTWGGLAHIVRIEGGALATTTTHVHMPLLIGGSQNAMAEIEVAGPLYWRYGDVSVRLIAFPGANYDMGYYLTMYVYSDDAGTTPECCEVSLWYVMPDGNGAPIASPVRVAPPGGTWTLRITYTGGMVRGYVNGAPVISGPGNIFTSFSYAGLAQGIVDEATTGMITSFFATDDYQPTAAAMSSKNRSR